MRYGDVMVGDKSFDVSDVNPRNIECGSESGDKSFDVKLPIHTEKVSRRLARAEPAVVSRTALILGQRVFVENDYYS